MTRGSLLCAGLPEGIGRGARNLELRGRFHDAGPRRACRIGSHAAGSATGTGPVRQSRAARRGGGRGLLRAARRLPGRGHHLGLQPGRRKGHRPAGHARRPDPAQRAGAGRLVADVLPRPVRQPLHLLPPARGDLPRQHRQARARDACGHGRRLPRHRYRHRAEEPHPHPRGDVPLCALRTRVPGKPTPAETRRPRGAHGGRAAAGARHRRVPRPRPRATVRTTSRDASDGRSGHAAPAAGLARRELAGGPRPTGRADPRAAGAGRRARTPQDRRPRRTRRTPTYLTFSERELAAAGGGEQTGDYSEAYISAWFTLTDAVAALKDARAGLEPAAAAAGLTPGQAAAAHPDLVHLLTELGPYFSAADDDSVHAAFLAVARAEPAPS